MSSARLPYSRVSQNPEEPLRPHLWLTVTGLNGASGAVRGLIDSGADITAMPDDYAALMGYTPNELEVLTVSLASGGVQALKAIVPCKASVVGFEAHEFELTPMFVPGADGVLWGRTDFFRAFDEIGFDDKADEFILTLA